MKERKKELEGRKEGRNAIGRWMDDTQQRHDNTYKYNNNNDNDSSNNIL